MRLDELIEYLKYDDLINFKRVDITGISSVNFGTIGLVTLGGLVWFSVFYFIYSKKRKSN